MDYKRFNTTIIARIDKGEEICLKLQEIATKENIKLASITALGATDNFTVGEYDVASHQYHPYNFTGPFEIVSLSGTISTKDGNYYAHLHMSCANDKAQVVGGHLNQAIVSATCEMVITIIEGTVERYLDSDTGLNLFKF